MLSNKSSLPRSASVEVEPAGPPLMNEGRRSTLSETLSQANSNISSMDQHPGTYIYFYTSIIEVLPIKIFNLYFNFETDYQV